MLNIYLSPHVSSCAAEVVKGFLVVVVGWAVCVWAYANAM